MERANSKYIKEISNLDRMTIIKLSNNITFLSLRDVQNEFAEATKNIILKNILFDLKDVTQTDTAGIAGLVDLLRYMKGHHNDGKIGLLNLSENMRSLLTISKVGGIFKDYKSQQEALEELG